MTEASAVPELTLGHVVTSLGLDLTDVLVIRHTFTADGLTGPADLTVEKVIAYTREQHTFARYFPADPPSIWLLFVGDGKLRSRFYGAFENKGEITSQRTEDRRFFDLHPSDALASLRDRLVIEWQNARSWQRRGASAAGFTVVEIADPEIKPFPGYDHVLLPHHELQTIVEDSRYASWRTALGAVQGIYLITDTSTGKQYVGKADGSERLLGRWTSYAKDGHGGNVALRQLAGLDARHARHFLFSILRVFGPSTSSTEVDAAESHYKNALLSRDFGLNRN
jgi:hypothetical protein